MKVYIGPYPPYVGPYQLADLLQYLGFSEAYCSKVGDWLADTWIADVCEWIEAKRKRTVKIKLHEYDSWNVDDTLALIILPLLKQLRENQQGSPGVQDEDLPEELRSVECWETRWKWVLDEMIWAFEQLVNGSDDNLFQTYSNEEYLAHHQRIDRGTTLFGKYFRGLWD